MAYQDEATEAAEMDINNPARRGLNKLVRVDMADPARMSVGDRSRVIIGDAARMNMNDPARLSVGNAPRVVINDPARMMHYPQMTYAMERREDRVVRDRLDVVDGDDDNVRSGTSIDV